MPIDGPAPAQPQQQLDPRMLLALLLMQQQGQQAPGGFDAAPQPDSRYINPEPTGNWFNRPTGNAY